MTSRRFLNILALTCLALSLTGCSATARHAFRGALVGASVGAATAALTSGDVARGTLIGGVSGAAVDAAFYKARHH